MTYDPIALRKSSRRIQALIILAIVVAAPAGLWSLLDGGARRPGNGAAELSDQARRPTGAFAPTPAQWATLTVEPVTKQIFRSAHVTEGKIAVDEDRSTLIFSSYSGRVTKLLAKPGDTVAHG